MLRLASTQIARISQVLRDMLDFARQRPPARAPLDLASVVESGLRLASFDKAFKRLAVTTDFDERLPRIAADADQLQQVFLNLFLNARDAMPEGGELRVRAFFDEADAEAVVEVTDSGHGIAPDDLPHVFDPFFTTKRAGAGLGLAVCYGIVTAHGGRITVANADGRGTTVRLRLPAGEDDGAGLAPRASSVQTPTTGKLEGV
jgi:two-component system NtrC family sensor kinase